MKAKIALLTVSLVGIFFTPRISLAGGGGVIRVGGGVTVDTKYGSVSVYYEKGDYGYRRRGRSPYSGAPEPTYRGRRGRSPYSGAPEPTYGGRRIRYTGGRRGPTVTDPTGMVDLSLKLPSSKSSEDSKREKALNRTLKRLDSADPSERMAALDTLGGFTLSGEDKEALERLEELVEKDPAQAVRLKAVEVLSSVKSEKILPVLEKASSEDPSEEVRQEAKRAHQQVEVLLLRQKIAELSLAMRAGDKDERLDALDDLEKIPQPVSKRILLSCAVSDPEPDVREKAVKKLEKVLEKDDPAIRRLEKISRDDPSEDVREEAEEVIEDLSDD